MSIYYDIKGTLVSEAEYLAMYQTVASGSEVIFSDGRKISGDAQKARLKVAGTVHASFVASRSFAPIGIGKPLTMWITSAYVGKLPPKGRLGKKGGMLSSSVKSWNYQDAKPRALNALKKEMPRNGRFQFAVNESGAPLAFYSPALVDRQPVVHGSTAGTPNRTSGL